MEEYSSDQEFSKNKKPSEPEPPTYTMSDRVQSEESFTVSCGCPVIGVATVEIGSGWGHAVQGHAEVNKDHLINAISNPTKVFKDVTRPEGTAYVFQGIDTPKPTSNSKIHAFVKIAGENKVALLSTTFYMKNTPKGDVIWERGAPTPEEE